MIDFPRTVHAGMRGRDIYVYKRALRKWETLHDFEHNILFPVRTGVFTSGMVPTVKAFQHKNELHADGWIGPRTYERLYHLIDAYGRVQLARYNRLHPGFIAGYPLRTTARYSVIGCPYEGTHTLGNWESDRAVDIACPTGTPVVAIWAGTIGSQWGPLDTTSPQLLGLRAHLLRADGEEAYYAHCSRLTAPPGTHLKAGQLLGYSGEANGVQHLHFATKIGRPENEIGQPGVC